MRTSVPRPSEIQSSVQPPQIQAKSNEEGLAEHVERLKKFQRLGNSMMQMGPPRLDNNTTSSVKPKPWIQRKLTIGEPGDKYEQEADRVASQVVQQINTPPFPQFNQEQSVQRENELVGEMQAKGFRAAIQRRQAMTDEEASADLESAINRARGSGQPLDSGLQQSMGLAMGTDFSGVRVHTDAQSDRLNQSIQARAFTTGQDVFFREGAYQPGGRGGQELIAHELTHVVQQNRGLAQPLGGPEIVRFSDFWIERSQGQLTRQSLKPNIQQLNTEELRKVRATVTQDKSPKEKLEVKQSLIPISNNPATIQRFVGRVDSKERADRNKSEDFVAAYEVERMVEYLFKNHGGPVIDVQAEDNIEILAGEHWFAGHGDIVSLGDLNTSEFMSKLDFSKLETGKEVTLNIISCNLGSITETHAFANDLRRRIQDDKENKGKIIIIKAAPSYIFQTDKIQGSYPSKDSKKAINDLHEFLSVKEKDIDRKYGENFWNEIMPILKNEEKIKTIPSKGKLKKQYKQTFSNQKSSNKLQEYINHKGASREKFIEVLEAIAKQDAEGFLYSSSILVGLINVEDITNSYRNTLEAIKLESEELWLKFEEKLLAAQKANEISSSDEVLEYVGERAQIKEKLKGKDTEMRNKYGWIEYSTKGKHKDYAEWENPKQQKAT